ncbi:MAG: serine/threonine-protein kinase, partial [Deltaproteobacteria bacterium]
MLPAIDMRWPWCLAELRVPSAAPVVPLMPVHHAFECLQQATIVGLLEGELEGAALTAAEAHLAQCEQCRALVAAAGQAARAGLSPTPPHLRGVPVRLEERYEIVRFIAAGGMGRVYEAVNRHTGQRVAIKSLAVSAEDEVGTLLLRFAREGQALRRLDHPNIVKLLEVVDGGDQHHLVMEYVAGGSLRDAIRRQGPLDAGHALRLLLELADALSRAHHLQILHRDIKPANVLLAEDGTARLTDFGLARMGDSRLTQSGAVLGTVPYLCPEVLWGKPVDARADLWSLGVTLFEMLSGQLPFVGDTQGAIVTAILNQPPSDLRALRPGMPAALIDLLQRM